MPHVIFSLRQNRNSFTYWILYDHLSVHVSVLKIVFVIQNLDEISIVKLRN